MTKNFDDVKKLGFGLMRLPQKEGVIDVERVKTMVDMFLDAGFNYFDTAFAYAGSEDAIRQALVNRVPREKFFLATKNAAWLNCKTKDDAVAQFETSLRQTGAGYFDFYLLHNLGESRTHFFDDFDMWSWIQEKKREGLVRHAGFSFHSTPQELEEILIAHPEAEFVQLQINYADWDNPAVRSRECYEVARKHGKPVIVMEPVKGGMLANPPKTVLDVLKGAEPDSSAASWALRFAAGLDGVLTVLSGMSNEEQMRDNISCMKGFSSLDEKERLALSRAQEEIKRVPLIPCTTCNYCAKVCPQNIGISGTFTADNYFTLYGNRDMALSQADWLVDRHGRQRRQMRRLRKLRKGVPSAYRNTQRAEKIGEGALLKRFCFKTGLGQSRFLPRRNCGFVSDKRRVGCCALFGLKRQFDVFRLIFDSGCVKIFWLPNWRDG